MVYNTVAHIQSRSSEAYTLNTSNITQMMIILLVFLLQNGLMSIPGQLVFFTDGARNLRLAIHNTFCFLPFKIILDWYHLKKKCKDPLLHGNKRKTGQTADAVRTAGLVVAWKG
jgi:hypothetical protein